MFWSGLRPVTNAWRRQLKLALENDVAVYSMHLPLDLHPLIGNNVLLMRALGIENSEPFFEEKGSLLGRRAPVEISLGEIVHRLEQALGSTVRCTAGAADCCREIAVITGGAGGEIGRVAADGIDTFITGEAPHWAAIAARDLGVNLLLGGHYATETFGVKALAAHLAERFGLDWTFIDLPSGL
jgi:dinuclear metal center YbgI/SA1388 family protein